MNSDGDLIGTLFTFLTFVLIIVLPMAMAYLQARKDRKAGYMHEQQPSGKPAETKRRKPRSAAKGAGGIFSSIDLLRRQERESEPAVSFSEGRSTTDSSSAGREGKRDGGTERHEIGKGAYGPRPSQSGTSQQLGEKFTPIEAMSNEFGSPLSNITEGPVGSISGAGRAALPGSAAVSRLRDLNEMQRAILLSEILGPPKGLE